MPLTNPEIWSTVLAERRRLAEDLDPIDDSGWNAPSLCPGWSVHDVLAHLVDTARTGKAAFVLAMIRAGGDFDRANDAGVQKYRQADPRGTLAAFREAADLKRTPPASPATRLVEAIVHGEDIRRPLGLAGDYPAAAVSDALEYQLRTKVSFGGGKERAEGLRLVASDSGSTWGDGPEVSGSGLDLLVAVSGRPVDAARFTGAGAARFAELTGS